MRKRNLLLLLTLLTGALLLSLALIQPAAAQNTQPISMTIQIGYDGHCKNNAWMPVRVTLENTGPNLETRLEATEDGSATTYAYDVSLPSQSRKEILFYIFPEQYLYSINFVLMVDKDVLLTQNIPTSCMSNTDLLYGVMASNPSAYNVFTGFTPPNGYAAVAQIDPAALPEWGLGLESLDMLLISDVDTGSLSADQRAALSIWVAGGGQLIVTGGVGWQKTAAGLQDLLPLIPNNTQTVTSLQALADFAHTAAPTGSQSTLVATGDLTADAQVLIQEDNLPLAAWHALGSGSVFYLAFDPAQDPLWNWQGGEAFYRHLLYWRLDAPSWAGGFRDWANAQEAAVDMPALQVGFTLLICCFLAIYVVAIGPLNFLALRYLKRRELAWVSIPLLVIFFSGISFLVGGLTRGRQPVMNRVSVVQVWSGLPQARVDMAVGIYSPRRATYELSVGSQAVPHPIYDYYSMSPRSTTVLQSGATASVPGLRIEVGTTEAMAVEGMVPAPQFTHDLRLDINAQGTFLRGSVTNQSGMTLQDAVLLYPGGAFQMDDLPSGQSMEIDLPLTRSHAAGQNTSALLPTGAITSYNYYYGSYTNGDSTVEDILGTSYYYDDSELYQRYQLLEGLLGYYYEGGRGGGVYLAGWTEEAPLDVALVNRSSRNNDLTLYLVSLNPTQTTRGSLLKLTPGAFVWRPVNASGSYYQDIYYQTIYAGESYAYQFALARPVPYSAIEALTLSLQSSVGYGTTFQNTDLKVYLWNYNRAVWDEVLLLRWDGQHIPNPERYVGAGGTILLRLDNTAGLSSITLDQIDFTLEVVP